eukprot:10004340-Alexandrium_andersonii.AAC.1
MSASLVGSEMCIRDRYPPALPYRPAGPDAKQSRRAAWTSGRARGAYTMAVSYTHLTLPTICSV